MSENKKSGRVHPSDEAGQLMTGGDNAFRRGRYKLAYHLYQEAITHLEMMWDTTHSREVGYRLSRAYLSCCYPAWRKFLARNTPKVDKAKWGDEAFGLEKRALELEIELNQNNPSMTDEEIIGSICHLHNLAGDLMHYRPDEHEAAQRYADEAYAMLKHHRPDDDEMPTSLDFGFKHIRAQIALQRGELAEALSLSEAGVAFETERAEKARSKGEELPPNWLKIALDFKAKVDAAIMKAAIDTVLRKAKL